MSRYSVVIPCYKSSKSIAQVVSDTVTEFGKIGIDDFEFVLVNDCSPDNGATIHKLYELGKQYPYVKVINLGKNAGQHNATMAGLNYATGDFIISMDDDLQTNPSQIKVMKEKIEEGYDLVYGYYEEKKESLFRRMGSALNFWTVRLLINKPKWLKTSSFWIIRRYVRDYAIQYTHPNVHLQGIFLRITDNIACVPIQHYDRAYGSSTYTLKKLIKLYGNIAGYSLLPIAIVAYLGFILTGAGLIADIAILINKIINPAVAAGWSSILGSICLFCGMILASLGVVGIYVGRLLLGQTNAPQFVVRDLTNVNINSDPKNQEVQK